MRPQDKYWPSLVWLAKEKLRDYLETASHLEERLDINSEEGVEEAAQEIAKQIFEECSPVSLTFLENELAELVGELLREISAEESQRHSPPTRH